MQCIIIKGKNRTRKYQSQSVPNRIKLLELKRDQLRSDRCKRATINSEIQNKRIVKNNPRKSRQNKKGCMTTIIILNHILQEMIKASKNKSLEPQHYHENVTTYNSGNYIRTLK